MPFTITLASNEDVPAIAKIFLSDETSSFLRLQLGTVDPAIRHKGFEDRLMESIQKPGQLFLIAKDDESGETVSFAQWQLPRGEHQSYVELSPEDRERDAEEYRKKLLPGLNGALIMDFREKLRTLRRDVLKGRRHYTLNNIGTLPYYKRRGAASALTRWPFEDADRDKVAVYLDTDQDGAARRIYESLGFRRVGETVIDLAQYGSTGTHIHIAMIRDPQ